jgi:hypothetical protein
MEGKVSNNKLELEIITFTAQSTLINKKNQYSKLTFRTAVYNNQ